MNTWIIGGLALGVGFLLKWLYDASVESDPAAATGSADPTPPVVPTDSGGQVKAKIPQPVKPEGWQPVARFVTTKYPGLSAYNSAFKKVLVELLKQRTVAKLGPAPGPGNGYKYQIHALGLADGKAPGALVIVKMIQSAGRVALASKTLFEGDAGQTGALIVEVEESFLPQLSAQDAASLAIVPKL